MSYVHLLLALMLARCCYCLVPRLLLHKKLFSYSLAWAVNIYLCKVAHTQLQYVLLIHERACMAKCKEKDPGR